jgi:hypothetical protein
MLNLVFGRSRSSSASRTSPRSRSGSDTGSPSPSKEVEPHEGLVVSSLQASARARPRSASVGRTPTRSSPSSSRNTPVGVDVSACGEDSLAGVQSTVSAVGLAALPFHSFTNFPPLRKDDSNNFIKRGRIPAGPCTVPRQRTVVRGCFRRGLTWF